MIPGRLKSFWMQLSTNGVIWQDLVERSTHLSYTLKRSLVMLTVKSCKIFFSKELKIEMYDFRGRGREWIRALVYSLSLLVLSKINDFYLDKKKKKYQNVVLFQLPSIGWRYRNALFVILKINFDLQIRKKTFKMRTLVLLNLRHPVHIFQHVQTSAHGSRALFV